MLLTQRQVRQRKEELKAEYGDKCHIKLKCKGISGPDYRIKTGEDLLLDHKDNNRHNNDPKNHQLGCRPCNTAKNPRGKTRFDRHKSLKTKTKRILVGVREHSFERVNDMGRVVSLEELKNREGEEKFRQWLKGKVKANGSWPLDDTINAGAEVAKSQYAPNGMSPRTVERWVKKALSSEGEYDTDTRADSVVVIKFKGAIIRRDNNESKG